MVVHRPLVVDLSGKAKDEPATATNVVRLREADLVRDEPPEVPAPAGPGDPPRKPADGGKARDALPAAQSWSAAVYTISPFESDSAAPDIDQTLGQLITAIREQRRISRESVSEQTHIPAHYLRMIESDNYDAVPDELYLLPFIRRYAIFLGLDSQKVVSRFISDFEKAENEVVETSAASIRAKASLISQRTALVAMIIGVLLPCLGWVIGTVRTTVGHPADGLPPATTSTSNRAPSKVLATYAPPVTAVQQPALPPADATAPPATATTSPGPKIDQQLAQARPSGRRDRRHRHSGRPLHRR